MGATSCTAHDSIRCCSASTQSVVPVEQNHAIRAEQSYDAPVLATRSRETTHITRSQEIATSRLAEDKAQDADDANLTQCTGKRKQPAGEKRNVRKYFDNDISLFEDVGNGPLGARPIYKFSTGATYLGQWKGRARHGFGRHAWADGTSFIGDWEENVAQGRGCFSQSDGDVFIGEWVDNSAHGLGICWHNNGKTSYVGSWLKDVKHGYGCEQWESGANYKGQFELGMKHGVGVYEWPDGTHFSGEWRANCTNGYGEYIGLDGRRFCGCWLDSLTHGCGRYIGLDGHTFCGQYVHGTRHGFGVKLWKDGRRTDGYWHHDEQHGDKVEYDCNGCEMLQQKALQDAAATPRESMLM